VKGGLTAGVGRWFRERLGLDFLYRALSEHKVPAACDRGKTGWMYVFGNATLAMFLLQVLSGVALATLYVPSAEVAHESLIHINTKATFGAFLRGLHFFGASAMVTLMVIHLIQVFLTAAYKYPREATWMFGVVLFALVLSMAFTGQLLRWDENGLYGAVVAAKFVARVPLVGSALADLVLAGESVSGATLTRFFALHVFILPALIFLSVGFHVFLVVHHGICEPPKPGRKVDPSSYRAWYQKLKEKGVPYWPNMAWREALFALFVFVVIVTLAIVLGPQGPGEPPDPAAVVRDPKPDWYLLWYYALLWIKPRTLEAFVMVYAPILFFIFLFLLPIFANKGERSPSRRPWAVAAVLLALMGFVTLTVIGVRSPWFPEEVEPLTGRELETTQPRVLSGARVFNERGCQLCHAVRSQGGNYGPDLTLVALRLPPEVIALRTMNGIGDMPAYRETLSREELDEILAFLRFLAQEAPR
jgi:ubiquinol-cytochrome c reductase cytochrome b subunit